MKVRLPPCRPGVDLGHVPTWRHRQHPGHRGIILLGPEEPGKGSEKVALELAFPTGGGDDGVRVRSQEA